MKRPIVNRPLAVACLTFVLAALPALAEARTFRYSGPIDLAARPFPEGAGEGTPSI